MDKTYFVQEIQEKFDNHRYKDINDTVIKPFDVVNFADSITGESIRGTVGKKAFGKCAGGGENKIVPVIEVIHVTSIPGPDSQNDELTYLIEPSKMAHSKDIYLE